MKKNKTGIKTKDVLNSLLWWIAILAFGFVVITIDSLPLWALLILALVVWVAYILVIIRDGKRAKRDRERDEQYPVARIDLGRRNVIYDQEEEKA